MNTIETKPLCDSSSNLADMLAMVRGWTLFILEVKGQGHKTVVCFFINLADMLTMGRG